MSGHPIQNKYTFWYMRRSRSRGGVSESYEESIKQLGTFSTVRLPRLGAMGCVCAVTS